MIKASKNVKKILKASFGAKMCSKTGGACFKLIPLHLKPAARFEAFKARSFHTSRASFMANEVLPEAEGNTPTAPVDAQSESVYNQLFKSNNMSPPEIVAELNKHIIGQDEAKKAVAIALSLFLKIIYGQKIIFFFLHHENQGTDGGGNNCPRSSGKSVFPRIY